MSADDEQDFERSKEIMRRALRRTKAKRLEWKERDGRPSAFEVDLPSGNIEVGTEDNDGVPPYDFRIYGDSGDTFQLVYELRSRAHPELRDELADLYTTVSRQVNGSDPTLDGLLNDLNDLNDLDDEMPF